LSAGGRWRRTGSLLVIVPSMAAAALGAGSWARAHDPAQKAHDQKPHDHKPDDAAGAHVHAPVPSEYKSAHVPSAAWTDARMLARGREIHAVRCAVCHGDSGDGRGPAGLALPLKPPDLRDQKMVSEMAGNYWFWRVSEGGAVEPFKSMGSAMPAWKEELTVEDRWAVIAYQHTFTGHDGPHVVSEHAELGLAGHGQASTPASTLIPPAPAASGHRH
jgi:mono/diheme cytochrome c family protein